MVSGTHTQGSPVSLPSLTVRAQAETGRRLEGRCHTEDKPSALD